MPAFSGQRQENWESSVIFGYILSSRTTRAIQNSVSKCKKQTKPHLSQVQRRYLITIAKFVAPALEKRPWHWFDIRGLLWGWKGTQQVASIPCGALNEVPLRDALATKGKAPRWLQCGPSSWGHFLKGNDIESSGSVAPHFITRQNTGNRTNPFSWWFLWVYMPGLPPTLTKEFQSSGCEVLHTTFAYAVVRSSVAVQVC